MSETYTIYHRNTLLGKAHYQGTFASYGEAEEAARGHAERTRTFMRYEIWQGTPSRAKKQVGPEFRGTK